jgi:hypothetical protein
MECSHEVESYVAAIVTLPVASCQLPVASLVAKVTAAAIMLTVSLDCSLVHVASTFLSPDRDVKLARSSRWASGSLRRIVTMAEHHDYFET